MSNSDRPTGAEASCKGKVRHQSIESAQRAADSMGGNKKTRQIPYPCSFCGAFHIGHARRSANNKNTWR